ncbi:MAG: prenyltransferase/squalene oxidase repeat-containing protein, partial [Planctomycetota bacterium]
MAPWTWSLLALLPWVTAQERAAAHLGELQAGVNAAIDRGVERLLALQNRDGSWGSDLREPVAHFDRRNGETGLAVYTLRKCRVSAEHPALQRAAAFLEGGFPTHNYSVSTQLLALDALGPPDRWKDRMKELVDVLLSTRIRGEGTWGYPNHPGVYIDLSNTQYAALGLRAAAHSGLKIPKDVWLELVEGTLKYQQAPREIDVAVSSGKSSTGKREIAGFGYMHGERESPSASMTAAGISILGIAKEGAGRDLPAPLGRSLERAQRMGLAWIEREFSVEGNPHGAAAWHY